MSQGRSDAVRANAKKLGVGALFASVSSVAMVLGASPALAQVTSEDDEIVVTARRVAENLQDTPVAVTAYSGEQLREQGAVQLRDVANFAPGVVVRTGQASTTSLTIQVRGQTQTDTLATLDPSVGTYVDGVYWARAYGLNGDLLDVRSAQVLRGPQGTLFGRNTSGGAFILETNAPQLGEFSALLGSSIGDYGLISGTAVVNIPVGDTIAVRAAFQGLGRDGFIDDAVSGRDVNDADAITGRLRVLFEPTDNLSAQLSYERFETDSYYGARNWLWAAPTTFVGMNPVRGVGSLLVGGFANAQAYINGPNNVPGETLANNELTRSVAETDTYSARVNWNVGVGELQFIAAHRTIESFGNLDLDGSQFSIHWTFGSQDLEQTSYELQFSGEGLDNRLRYVLGALYFEESGADGSLSKLGVPSTVPGGSSSLTLLQRFNAEIDNSAIGYYGQATFAVTDRLNVTAGYRWSEEDKGITTRNTRTNEIAGTVSCQIADLPGVVAPDCLYTRADTFDGDSFTIGADYHLTEDVMIYASRSTGFRSGGQNLRMNSAATAVPFLPEEATQDEIGLRSEWFDSRLRLNVSAYQATIENVQRTTLITTPTGGTATVLGNAAEMEVSGIEVEASARVTDYLQFALTAATTDPDYVQYSDLSGDRRQERFQDVADFTYTVAAMYEQPVAWGEFGLRLDYSWLDEMALQPYNTPSDPLNAEIIAATTRPAGGVFNARATLNVGEHLEFALFGRNIGDNRDLVQALLLPAPLDYISGMYRDPATYGISATVRWGD